MDETVDKKKLRNKLSRFEDKIAELQDEADGLRKLLGIAPRTTLPASGHTMQLLSELCEEWGDDKETALMRCVERVHFAYAHVPLEDHKNVSILTLKG